MNFGCEVVCRILSLNHWSWANVHSSSTSIIIPNRNSSIFLCSLPSPATCVAYSRFNTLFYCMTYFSPLSSLAAHAQITFKLPSPSDISMVQWEISKAKNHLTCYKAHEARCYNADNEREGFQSIWDPFPRTSCCSLSPMQSAERTLSLGRNDIDGSNACFQNVSVT